MPPARRPEPLQGTVFRARDVIRRGILTRDALRRSAWRRLYRGGYTDATLPDHSETRIAGAALLMPVTAAFSGRTAAHLVGATELFDLVGPVEVTVPPVGRGSRQARQVAALADERAESQPESRVRVLLPLAGLPPVPRYTVRDPDGAFLARVDLAYPEHRSAVEYDGRWHADTAQFRRDRRRLNALVAAGWIVLHLTAADLRDPGTVVDRVRRLLVRREIGETGLRGVRQGPTTRISVHR